MRSRTDAYLNRNVWRIVLLYVLVAGSWIFFSDRILAVLVSDPVVRTQLSTIKGWLFVAVTATMLYGLIRRLTAQLRHIIDALRASDEHFRMLFDSSPDGIALVASDTLLLDANPALLGLAGCSREEVIGRPVFELGILTEEAVTRIKERLEQVFSGGPSQPLEIAVRNRRSQELWVEAFASVTGSGKESPFIQIIIRDISGRKRMEAALRESGEMLQAMVRSSPAAFILTDIEGRIRQWNPAAERLFNRRSEEVIGRSIMDFHAGHHPRFTQLMDRVKAGESISGYEVQVPGPDGGPVYMILNSALTRDGGGAVTGLMAVITDITEHKRVVEALRTSEARFRLLVESAPEAIYLETDGLFSYVNPAGMKLFGAASDAELIGHDVLERVHPDDRHVVADRIRLLERKHQPLPSHEHRYLRLDGMVIEVEVLGVPLVMPEGPRGMIFIRDITQRKLTETIVRLQRDLAVAAGKVRDLRQLLVLFLARAIAVSGLDSGGIYLVDEARSELELVSHCGLSEDFVHRVTHICRDSRQWKMMKNGQPIYYRLENDPPATGTGPDPDLPVKAVAVLPIVYQERTIACLNLGSHTLDEIPQSMRILLEGLISLMGESIVRLQAEQARLAAESRYREMLESVQLGAVTLDREGRITFCNDFLLTLTGWRKEELIGLDWFEAAIPEAGRDGLREMFRQEMGQGRIPPFGLNDIVTRDGQLRRFAWNNAVLRDHDGRPVGTASIGQDITELEQSREKEKLYQDQLQQAEKMATLGILASGVAHEINNPNNFIMMNAEIFSRAWIDLQAILERYHQDYGRFSLAGLPYEKARERFPTLIEGLIEGAKRIQSIVADLKEYAIPESGLVKDPVDVNRVLHSAVKLTRPLLQRTSTRFTEQLAPDLPPVLGSAQKLEQVFINLIQNACLALTDPAQAISVSSRNGGDRVIVHIADQGSGIDSEDLKHVFDPFFTTRRTHGGTGLGLPICQRIVADHGGTLGLESRVGEGTTVTVTLPAAPAGSQEHA